MEDGKNTQEENLKCQLRKLLEHKLLHMVAILMASLLPPGVEIEHILKLHEHSSVFRKKFISIFEVNIS